MKEITKIAIFKEWGHKTAGGDIVANYRNKYGQ